MNDKHNQVRDGHFDSEENDMLPCDLHGACDAFLHYLPAIKILSEKIIVII